MDSSLLDLPSSPPALTRSVEKGRPPHEYIEEPLFLGEPHDCFASLAKLDWSFAQEKTDFLGHDVHPYPAKFIPQLPGNLIARLSCRGEAILDPFGGSGTTTLEASRLGRRATSVDANPLAALIGRVKTSRLTRRASLELRGLHVALATELDDISPDPITLVTRYVAHGPAIPNRERWFSDEAFGELALVKARISELEESAARDVANVALSRMALRASFQDSETRYKSVPRYVRSGQTLRQYLRELESLAEALATDRQLCPYGQPTFVTGDARDLGRCGLEEGSFDLVVTSPPYGNATDYHLYHRFRLLWLGFSPGEFGRLEIGSHLKHQREGSGFESYAADLEQAVSEVARVLRPGRFAAVVLGSSLYSGKTHDAAEHLRAIASRLGFDAADIIRRQLPPHRRSFGPSARRATEEAILLLRKRPRSTVLRLSPPSYRLWPYEGELRVREVRQLLGREPRHEGATLVVDGGVAEALRARDLVFTHAVGSDGSTPVPTWQAVLENGGANEAAARKEPKYSTHGLHPYKGKFYPQLARGLINLSGVRQGATILDPFCGSGTTLLEAAMNGLRPFGCDMHPLAAKVARIKTHILTVDPDILGEAVRTVCDLLEAAPGRLPDCRAEFSASCMEEIERWFPGPVVGKLGWLLRCVRRSSGGVVRDFLEVVLSGVIRQVSHQEPGDLRIRYRAVRLDDADVLGLFRRRLVEQFRRVEKFWSARAGSPYPFHQAVVAAGDNRRAETFTALGLERSSVDLVLTSPPYATALPYIDTDRLSLLVLFGLDSAQRRPLEWGLTGSREIDTSEKRKLDAGSPDLPAGCLAFLAELREEVEADKDAGFRKRNQPALMTRYLSDMDAALRNVVLLCRSGAECMLVVGDNRTELAGKQVRIPTTDLVEELGRAAGFELVERLPITVTTDNHLHARNAITKNAVIRFALPT